MGASACSQYSAEGSICSVDVHDACTIPLVEDVLPSTLDSRSAIGARSLRAGIEDVWSAFHSNAHWDVDNAADVWQTFEEKDPCLAETVNLSVVAEKFESLPGIAMHYFVKVFLGNDEHGRTSFSSHKSTEWPPKTFPQLNFSGNNFMLKLFPMKINALGRRLLSTLMEAIPGTQEADLASREYHLCGKLGSKDINGCLELRLSWLQDGVLQYLMVPFIPVQTNFNVQTPLTCNNIRTKGRN